MEPKSASGVAAEVNNSALNGDFVGEAGKSTVLIIMETDNLQESAHRAADRKPPPNQPVITKLLNGVLTARNGALNEDSMRIAPCDQDLVFLGDGGRDTCKGALQDT